MSMKTFWNLCISHNSKILRKTFPLFFTGFIILGGCQYLKKNDHEGKVIARVHDHYLYESDLEKALSDKMSQKDSAMFVKNFVENWIKEELIFDKALDNLPENKKDKDDELKEYYRSLIRYEYENVLMHRDLDLIVSDDEIKDYYEKNKENFKLKRTIVRLVYFKVPNDAPRKEKLEGWLKSNELRHLDSLYIYGAKYATQFSIDDKTWHFLDEIQNSLPLAKYATNISANQYLELSDSTHHYYIRFKGFRGKNKLSPLEFVKDDIANIIINKRKIDLIKKTEQQIFEDAVRKNEFEIYEN